MGPTWSLHQQVVSLSRRTYGYLWLSSGFVSLRCPCTRKHDGDGGAVLTHVAALGSRRRWKAHCVEAPGDYVLCRFSSRPLPINTYQSHQIHDGSKVFTWQQFTKATNVRLATRFEWYTWRRHPATQGSRSYGGDWRTLGLDVVFLIFFSGPLGWLWSYKYTADLSQVDGISG